MIKVLCIIGTRPEAIKMIPVIYALRRMPIFNIRLVVTAQHREMLDQVLNQFDIHPDIDLNIMKPDQTLNKVAGRILIALDNILRKETPDVVLAQGDTTTVFAAAFSAYQRAIPFGHVEAGLRTGDFNNPFPEEMNRILVSKIATWHFAPSANARLNLLKEGISDKLIFQTGNTIIDMLRITHEKNIRLPVELDSSKRLIIVTAHRRENFGEPLREIFKAIRFIADTYHDIQIICPIHPNPNIESVARVMLEGHHRIHLCKPIDYLSFISLMKYAYLIMTDSGGIQEEAIALRKPVLVFRSETERPEGITLGNAILVGTRFDFIIQQAQTFLDKVDDDQRSGYENPYGDGFAGNKIVEILTKHFIRIPEEEYSLAGIILGLQLQ